VRRFDRLIWNVSVAWSGLTAHRGRSILATSGVAIGIGSVIIMAAIGAGLRENISTDVAALGSNVVFVMPGEATATNAHQAQLRDADLRAAAQLGVDVKAVSGQVRTQVVAAGRTASTTVGLVGADQAYGQVDDLKLEGGRLLNDDDIRRARMVAVVDSTTADDLDLGDDPVGQSISVSGRPFKIVGALQGEAGASQGKVVIPLSTLRQRIPRASAQPMALTSIVVLLRPDGDGERIAAELEKRLRNLRRLSPSDDLPLRLSTSAEFTRGAEGVVRALQAGLIAIASISLFVGAIGVMNIMLVAVKERTSEIGLRLAVGATPRDIREQFLTEAALLCIVGGVIGLLSGLLASGVISALSGWNAWPSPVAILASIIVSAGVGVAAGVMPATAAARLPPIVAIRRD
jgi:putative ABC transport system permease protein